MISCLYNITGSDFQRRKVILSYQLLAGFDDFQGRQNIFL